MQGVIMSIEKIKDEDVILAAPREDGDAQVSADELPGKQHPMLLLEVEEDDLGGDPYNRTGTFCQIELKNKVQ